MAGKIVNGACCTAIHNSAFLYVVSTRIVKPEISALCGQPCEKKTVKILNDVKLKV